MPPTMLVTSSLENLNAVTDQTIVNTFVFAGAGDFINDASADDAANAIFTFFQGTMPGVNQSVANYMGGGIDTTGRPTARPSGRDRRRGFTRRRATRSRLRAPPC
jgi:hypothetical protein